MTALSPNAVQHFAEAAAIDFADAYEIPVNHPEDEKIREEFATALEDRIENAIGETYRDFCGRAMDMAAEYEDDEDDEAI